MSPLIRFRNVYWVLVFCIFGSYVWYVCSMNSAAPSGKIYSFVSGHVGDFYAYLYMIHRGQAGHLLYKSVYSSSVLPELLIHPFFHIIGFLSQPFSLSPGLVFIVSRLVAWILLFYSAYKWINETIHRESTKVLAGVLFLSSTSFWSIRTFLQNHEIILPINWSDYFDTSNKYLRIPPHHILSFACLLWILLFITRKELRHREYIIGALFSICLGLLQPYIAFLLIIILGCYTVLHWIVAKKIPHAFWFIVMVECISVMLVGMNYVYLQFALHLPFASTSGVSLDPRMLSLGVYISALGPCAWASILAFTYRKYTQKISMKLLVLWAWIPFVLFLLPEIGNVTSTYRLFQTYQQLPFAILAAIGIESVVRLIPFRRVIVMGVIVASLVYGFLPYIHNMNHDVHIIHGEYFNVYIPEHLRNTFLYLDAHTPEDSMVLAGTSVSGMIPAFTHNRVLMGHESNTPDFLNKLTRAISFYQRKLSEEEMRQFLQEYHIEYIVFGIDAPTWQEVEYNSMTFLKPVYTNGPITVTKVQ